MGADFPRERFLRTPISVIRWLIRELEDQERIQADIESLTTAKLAALVTQIAHSFSGSKKPAPKTTAKDFLPFAHTPVRQQQQAAGPSEATKFILVDLMRRGQIPGHVFTALRAPSTN
jgi:hypothetical protein